MLHTKSQLRSVANITSTTALEAVNAALTEAQKVGVNISVAAVDISLNLIAYVHDDGATPHSAETSKRKANTAASTGKATGWMGPELEVTLSMASGNMLTNIPGGVPLRYGGVLGGGLGIAGGTVEQDDTIARATLEVIEADKT